MLFKKIVLAVAVAAPMFSTVALASPTLEAAALQDAKRAAWKRIETAKWVQDGKEDAPRIIYVITDPNCIWCHHFWEAARPWVDSGRVQIRHILVGIIKKASAGKAAAILSAPNPSIALKAHELAIKQGGIPEAQTISPEITSVLADNLRLMQEFGFRGTPVILYSDSDGDLVGLSGYPRDQLEEVMGSKKPQPK